jgi:hypothetical protein
LLDNVSPMTGSSQWPRPVDGPRAVYGAAGDGRDGGVGLFVWALSLPPFLGLSVAITACLALEKTAFRVPDEPRHRRGVRPASKGGALLVLPVVKGRPLRRGPRDGTYPMMN